MSFRDGTVFSTARQASGAIAVQISTPCGLVVEWDERGNITQKQPASINGNYLGKKANEELETGRSILIDVST